MGDSRTSMASQWWRRGLIVLVLATCIRVWTGPVSVDQQAVAQIPDSGLQRKQLLDETARTNELLSEILTHLRTQTLKVRIESTDKTAAAPAPVR